MIIMDMTIYIYAFISVVIVSLLSITGLAFFAIKEEKLKSILIYLVSFSTGALFADAFIHLLPESFQENGFGLSTSLYVLIGIAVSFIIEKFIHWNHCHHALNGNCQHRGDGSQISPFARMSLIGDSVHNFIDGLIIGASYVASIPIGLATTIAVILHEIPQEIGDFAILLHGGYTRKKALFLNFITGIVAIAGTIIALLLTIYVKNLTNFLIPFAAGGFIYIAGSDLIPELHKETEIKKSLLQLLTFILGTLIIAAMLLIE